MPVDIVRGIKPLSMPQSGWVLQESLHRMRIVSVVACRAAELTATMFLKGWPRQRECC